MYLRKKGTIEGLSGRIWGRAKWGKLETSVISFLVLISAVA